MNLPRRLFKFNYLRHLNLELVIVGEEEKEIDVLDYAQVLEVAPFIQKLELRMWMNRHQPYRKEDGELRSRPRHQHGHLRLVRMSGFFGHKDQVELALHILGSSVNLEKMEITPRIERTGLLFEVGMGSYLMASYADGYRVATEFVCKEDRRGVVQVVNPCDPYLKEVEHERP